MNSFHPVRHRSKTVPRRGLPESLPDIETVAFSADALEEYSEKAAALAADLRKAEPSYDLALAAGVSNRSYHTVRWGMVSSYDGEAIIEMADGRRWKAVGHGPQGSAEHVSKQGWIEFIPI